MLGNAAGDLLVCGVFGCNCLGFKNRKRRCKYGSDCYQTKAEHRDSFCHPGEPEWDVHEGPAGDREMCSCGHKKKLHSSPLIGASAVPYPTYWRYSMSPPLVCSTRSSESPSEREFNDLFEVDMDVLQQLQRLLDETYSDVTTRDRQRHSGSWEVPRGFHLQGAERNENSKLWRKYTVRKAELQQEVRELMNNPAEREDFKVFDDVKTTQVWESFNAECLDKSINEWYLFHGTSGSAALNICRSDFKMRLAGTATGTLYGRGSYLAESITKADEYSKEEDGAFTVLLCRVLGGRVRYCDEKTPDADALTKECVEGIYDCILGDRIKTSNTYREFILFDTENVYPEYLLKYTRGEFFKSKSHP